MQPTFRKAQVADNCIGCSAGLVHLPALWHPARKESEMANLNLSMPDQMKDWIDRQTGSGRYFDASDYVRDLIRRDQERAAKIAHMQELVDEGLASGISDETMEDILHSLQDAAE
jgi:antitoxin ParD1/3/4